jgi:hypothetical protein
MQMSQLDGRKLRMYGLLAFIVGCACVGCNGKGGNPSIHFLVDLPKEELSYTRPVALHVFKNSVVAVYMRRPACGAVELISFDLDTGQVLGRRTVAFRNRTRRIGPATLVVVPYETEDPGGEVLRVPRLTPQDALGEIAPGYPVPAEQPGVFGVHRALEDDRVDIYAYNTHNGDVTILQGLGRFSILRSRLVSDRLIISGLQYRPKQEGDDSPERTHITQLWTRPSMTLMKEYVGPTWLEAGSMVGPVQLGDYFAFKVGRGQWRMCKPATGKVAFTVGKEVSHEEWFGLGLEIIEPLPGSEYVRETGSFVTIENVATSGKTHIVSYDADDGERNDSVAVAREDYERCWIDKVDGQWVVVIRTQTELDIRPLPELSKKIRTIPVPNPERRTEALAEGHFVTISDDMKGAVYGLGAAASRDSP